MEVHEVRHERALTVRTAALSQHARETDFYSDKISHFQRPLDPSASITPAVDACHIKHFTTAADTGGASSGAAAECSEVDTENQNEAQSRAAITVNHTDVQEIL